MNKKPESSQEEEQDLIKLYMELTGANEATARSVFMYVCPSKSEPGDAVVLQSPTEEEAPDRRGAGGGGAAALAALAALGFWLTAFSTGATPASATNTLITRPLSLADTIDLALRQNPGVLRAQKELEVAQGIVVQTRAIAVPKLGVTGGYNAMQRSDVDVINFPAGFLGAPASFGNDQNWSAQVRVVQSLYEGGRMVSAWRVAKLTREQSLFDYQATVADTVRDVQVAYYDVLLAKEQITVQEASVNLLTNELTDTTRRYDAGTVPRFNVLRADVELANARPRLIRARNSLRISKNNLANLLGLNLPRETLEDIPLSLSGKLAAEPYQIGLPEAVGRALRRRPELESLRRAEGLRKEAVVNAKSGYLPSVQAYGGYDAHNSALSPNLSYEDHGWIAGVQVNWNVFDGFLTRGKVQEARARFQQAGIELDDTSRRIELEVRTAHSVFIEADEVLRSQEKALEEAEEALRLATARNEAGTGTQLDVLSAQTALTEARSTRAEALHDYSVARARLDRAMGVNVPGTGAP